MTRLMYIFRKLRFYVRAYTRLDIMNKSASLSFYTFISIFPTLFLLLAASRYFVSSQILIHEIERFLDQALPYQSDLLVSNLKTIFTQKKTVNIVGGVSLLISAQVLFVNLEKMVNGLLHTRIKRHFLVTRFMFLLWLGAMVFSLFAPLLIDLFFAGVGLFGFKISLVARMWNQWALLIIAFAMFVLVMLIVPSRKVNVLKTVLGGILFVFGFGLGKWIFKAITFMSLGRYNLVYGSLTTLVLGALWIFYFYNIFLMCVYWVGRENDPFYLNKHEEKP